ncbi:MAG TPA: tetratricopeptide repeat protein [Candidatus Eisenbacteria bacterium]|nr:tetratricopeptide repeat protein [Candidatus Eisenbacteria bacterium]
MSRFVRFEGYQVDLQTGELRKNGTRVRLSGQPFQILALLLERPGELISREDLRTKLWPDEVFVDFDHSLNAAVNKLREALCDSTSDVRFIETLPKRGYRFIGPIETRDKPATLQVHVVSPGPAPPALRNRLNRLHIPLKHALALSVLVLAGLLTGLYLYSRRSHNPSGNVVPAIHSIAVLPLKNLSGDPAQEYFADGMTEEIIGRLSMIRGLRVISRTSAMHFKDTRAPLPEIAKALGVDAMVEGSVVREGGRVRVHAQLIRAATDEHFWSETYDRELGDALALESDVAQAIAARVEVTVTGAERARLVAARQVSPDVYENFLKGQLAERSNSPAATQKSIAYFEEAIKKDPAFAPAYLGLAHAYDALGMPGVAGAPPSELQPKVISAVRKALELDPALPGAHALMGSLYQMQWQWNDAEREYKLALELDPNDAGAHLSFSTWLLSQGHTEEALAWSRRARELDPIGITGNAMGWILFQSRHYDEAVRELRSDLAVHKDDASTYWSCWFLGFALSANGQPDEAIPVLERALALSERNPAVIGVLVRAYAHAGRRTEALRLLDELKRRQQTGYIPSAALVNAYLGLGDNEQTFSWLERAYKEHSPILQYIKVHPFFDPLRGDPRFANLVRRVGLPETR